MFYTAYVLIAFGLYDYGADFEVFPKTFPTLEDCELVKEKMIKDTEAYNKEWDRSKELHARCDEIWYVYPPE